ncbi:MAG: ATP-grasp domain-containing protein [Myxococcaceae bacterium]|nr:ATP-grasp domain-containing protein [Myxococcaceae bacterium]MCA3012605.1 ATP-grasp domain-containing protein [Myxococcaceae bacterium]
MTVGILGGGQLGLMLAEALQKLDTPVRILEPDPSAPCAQRLSSVVRHPLDDAAGLEAFFRGIDRVTYDSENIPSVPLEPHAHALAPSLHVLTTSQHRGLEKTFLAQHGFRPVHFAVVGAEDSLHDAVRRFGAPCIVKSALGGYDGKGQHRLRAVGEAAALPDMGRPWVLEEVLSLEAEVSCIVARDGRGGEVTFPVFENVHVDHVLDVTVLPARVDEALQEEARRVALGIARALEVVGLLTVEFFVGTGRDGVRRLYVNELAPRVHNSGHVTRQACTLSQFDALARILSGVPLTAPRLHPGGWCMGNLLGDVWLAQGHTGGPLDLEAWQRFPEVVDVYLYGKHEARPKRKMGHFVVHADTADAACLKARAFRDALQRR